MTCRIDGNLLELPSKARATFPHPVAEVLAVQSVFIVRLAVPAGVTFNENIFGLDAGGRTLWQVRPRKYAYDDSPFTGMTADDRGVTLYNWDGLDLLIDPRSGEVLGERMGK